MIFRIPMPNYSFVLPEYDLEMILGPDEVAEMPAMLDLRLYDPIFLFKKMAIGHKIIMTFKDNELVELGVER